MVSVVVFEYIDADKMKKKLIDVSIYVQFFFTFEN